MKMYVIGDKYNADWYWNLTKDEFSMEIDGQSLFPTRELAQEYIEEQLGSDFVTAEITIYQITRDGNWEYSIQDIQNMQDEVDEV